MKSKLETGKIISLVASVREEANAFILNALASRGVDDVLPIHGAVLHALFEHSPMQMNELALRIGRKKNTVTGIINTLESRGYCRREPDPQDARAQLVLLTEQGESMRELQAEVSKELQQKVWGNIDEAAQINCVATLMRILENLQEK